MTQQEASDDTAPTSWREQAVARRLDPARTRAETRVQRFLDAAFELLRENRSGADFTVQEVVERSGQSLRSFYQYFGGKQELLLALFEESVSSTAEHLRAQLAPVDDPLERLHRFVVEYYRMCRLDPKRRTSAKNRPSQVIVEFAQQLLTAEPNEAARVFVPMVTLFEDVLQQAVEAGVVREGLSNRRVAGTVLEAIMFNTFAVTIGGKGQRDEGDPAEDLWDLLFRGLASDDAR